MRRIAVIGNAGTGKSTLAEQIGQQLDVKVIHLDRLLWKPGWQLVGEEEFARRHAALVERESWVIEGLGYPSALEARIAAADMMIFTRYALWRCYWWSLKRELRPGRAAGRPADCPMLPAATRLIGAIRRTHDEILPEVDCLLERHSGDTSVHVLRSPRDIPPLLQVLARSRPQSSQA